MLKIKVKGLVYVYGCATVFEKAVETHLNDFRFADNAALMMLADTVYDVENKLFLKNRDVGKDRLNGLLELTREYDDE